MRDYELLRLYFRRLCTAVFLPGLCFADAFPVAAAESGAELVVSATRSDRPIELIGSSVSTLTADDLAKGQFPFVLDALRSQPGVVVAQNGGPGGVASLRLRGSSAGQTLVVIDGVRANDPAAPQGGFNAANLAVSDIGRIEILRGPQGLAWGADAIGGVIALATAEPAGRTLDAYAEGGRYGTARGAFALSAGQRETAYARAQIYGQRSSGFSRAVGGSEPDFYRTVGGSLRAGARLSRSLDGDVVLRAQHANAGIDGFPPPAFALSDTDETERTDDFAVSARLKHRRLQETGLAGVLTVGFQSIDRVDFESGAETFSAQSRRIAAGYALDWAATRQFSLTAGAEGERQAVDVSGIDKAAFRGGAFAIAEWRVAPTPRSKLNLSAGVRRDEFSNFSGATTARVAASLALGGRMTLRASWGEGFRAPTLFELNFSQFGIVPNPDLRPEQAHGMDAGVEWRSGGESPRAVLRTTYFDTRTRDLIDFSFAQNGYFNVKRARSRGVETEIVLRPVAWLTAQAGYSFLDARDIESGEAVLRQPRHRGSAILTIAPIERLSLAATLLANGRERDVPADNAAFARFDLKVAYEASPAIEVYGRIENVTDTEYQDVSGYAETGRGAYAGLRVRL